MFRAQHDVKYIWTRVRGDTLHAPLRETYPRRLWLKSDFRGGRSYELSDNARIETVAWRKTDWLRARLFFFQARSRRTLDFERPRDFARNNDFINVVVSPIYNASEYEHEWNFKILRFEYFERISIFRENELNNNNMFVFSRLQD